MRFVAALLATLVAALSAPTIDVHLIGDSTMANRVESDTNPERGWGQYLGREFDSDVAVHNHAVNGRSTKSFITEGKWAVVLGQLKSGDYLLIEFGHNDEKIEDSTRYAEAHTAYRQNLERFVSEARAKGATPILLTPIVRRKFDANGTLENTHGDYPGVVRELAAALKVPLIDLEAQTRSLIQKEGAEPSKRLYNWTAKGRYRMYPDGHQDDTHLNVAGAGVVARMAALAIAKLDIPLAHHVREKP